MSGRNLKTRYAHQLFARQSGICPLCSLDMWGLPTNIDHIIPRSKGGRNLPNNLQLVHVTCNSAKADSLTDTVAWCGEHRILLRGDRRVRQHWAQPHLSYQELPPR